MASGEPLADAQPVLAGKHHVQHNDVDGVPIDDRIHARSIDRPEHLQAVSLEKIGDKALQGLVIVDNKDRGRRG
jgi:hypothetical protein